MRRILHLHSRQHLYRLLALVALFLLSACSAQTSASPASTPDLASNLQDQAVLSTSVQLGWIHNYSTANFYTAEKNGHYAAQKLSVELIEGGFGEAGYIDPIEEVVTGKADFGLSNAYSVVEARAEGKPLIAVAAIFQRNPAAIFSLKSSNIQRPKDLAGRRVLVNSSTNSLEKMLKLHNVDPNSLEFAQRSGYGVEELINGEADAMLTWVINEGVMLDEAGVEYNTMLLSDYGIYEYETVLFTSEELIKNNPELVQRFVSATLQGVQDVIDKPSEAVDYVIEYGEELEYASEHRRIQALLPILKQPNASLGQIDHEIWMLMLEALQGRGVQASAQDVEASYTNQFLAASISKQ